MRYQNLLRVSKVTIAVGSLWWHIVGASLAGYSIDCHVSITFQSFLSGLVCCCLVLSFACLIPSQGLLPINTILLPLPCAIEYLYIDILCMCQIYTIHMTSSVIFICCGLWTHQPNTIQAQICRACSRAWSMWGSLTLIQCGNSTFYISLSSIHWPWASNTMLSYHGCYGKSISLSTSAAYNVQMEP